MRSRRFDNAYIVYLQQVFVMITLDVLGIYWKRDATSKPPKDEATVRVHASLGGAVVELLTTGLK